MRAFLLLDAARHRTTLVLNRATRAILLWMNTRYPLAECHVCEEIETYRTSTINSRSKLRSLVRSLHVAACTCAFKMLIQFLRRTASSLRALGELRTFFFFRRIRDFLDFSISLHHSAHVRALHQARTVVVLQGLIVVVALEAASLHEEQ